jgi:hypothetical protein
MLSSPHKVNPSFIEATVLHVNSKTFTCSVKTIIGQIYSDVRWLMPTGGYTETGLHVTPNIQDRVLVITSLGYPLIIGCIPKLGAYNGETPSMTDSAPMVEVGSSSTLKGKVSANPSKPSDYLPGDFVYTVRGGGLLAILSSGIAILKASTLAQIIITKFEGLVRIVSRNYQRFSDSSTYVSVNMKGRLYDWFGSDWLMSRNKNNTERYEEVYGDVAAGEVLRGAPAPGISLPSRDTRIRKQALKDASGNVVMVETLYEDGHVIVRVQNTSNSNTSTYTNSSTNEVINGGGNTSTKSSSNSSITESVSGGGGTSTISINTSGISIDYNGVSTCTLNGSQSSLESNGHFCRVTSAGVSLG